jgi:hypothetical protein
MLKAPVFVLGVPRSGTTLLYSMLISAGGFAVYRKETFFYDLVPRFGALKSARSREEFLKRWLHGHLGKVPGLDVASLAREALGKITHRGEFLPRLMDAIAAVQGAERWVEATPAHLMYIDEIRQAVPDALIVHVIRDGRDCALSYERQGWIATLPWDRSRRVGVAALFWEWMVRNGRAHGQKAAGKYLEVKFEDLVADPAAMLERVGRFIDHDLDYDRIRQDPVHALRKPNTSFRGEQGDFKPVGRWQRSSSGDVRLCEVLVGGLLVELGYELATAEPTARERLQASAMRKVYLPYFASKHFLKAHTPLGMLLTRTSFWDVQPRGGSKTQPAEGKAAEGKTAASAR